MLLETVDAVGGVVEATDWGEVVEVTNNFTLMHVDTKYLLTRFFATNLSCLRLCLLNSKLWQGIQLQNNEYWSGT